MSFDSWQRWGIDLDDASFANAWTALGLAPAASPPEELRSRILDALARRRRADERVRWTFPRAQSPRSAPRDWARAWVEAAGLALGESRQLRLRVEGAPPEEPIRPWFRLLSEARPTPDSASLHVEAPRAQLHLDWPLRLGHLPGSAAERLIDAAREKWPSDKLTDKIQLDREHANCDLLIHAGSARTLLQTLLSDPIRKKANLVVLHGDEAGDWGEIGALLAPILSETRASGFVLVPGKVDSGAFAHLVNGFVAELSHANPPDVALARCTRDHGVSDVIAGFTSELTAFRLPSLAQRYNERAKAMPAGTDLDLSGVGQPSEWLTRGVNGGGLTGGTRKNGGSPDADRCVPASTVSVDVGALTFDSEHQGGSTIADVSRALTTAKSPPEATAQRAARFLQQRSAVRPGREYVDAKEGFLAGKPALVRVRIGPPDESWNSLPDAFPVERLPEHVERWTLTVWLTEPDHLDEPLRGQIRLPRDGESTECEFRFRPRASGSFAGRLTVLHRGRVIQTAVLRAAVTQPGAPAATDGAPRLHHTVAVRHRLGELGDRRQYDLAFVLNHDESGRPLLNGLSEKSAWIHDLSQSRTIAGDINARLSVVAKSVADYAKGLRDAKGEQLLVQLAQHGGWLHLYLVEGQLNAAGNRAEMAQSEYLQIVSTRADAVVPFEFVYDYAVPEDGANLCAHWEEALRAGRCPGSGGCDPSSARSVCPMGFWGLKKVIERHAVTPQLAKEGAELYLQSEQGRQNPALHLGGVAVVGGSARVPAARMTELMQTIAARCGAQPARAPDWKGWADLVGTHRPTLMIALPHTDGQRANVSLELGGSTFKTINVRREHVYPEPGAGFQPPVVALLGCDVAGTADDYGFHVVVWRARGAAIVIGTIATVFGEHAALVAGKLVEGMLPGDGSAPLRLGEALRALKRKALLDDLLMPLCLVAYGDADWILAPKGGTDAGTALPR